MYAVIYVIGVAIEEICVTVTALVSRLGSTNNIHQANQIDRACNTMFMIGIDTHKIIFRKSSIKPSLSNETDSTVFEE